MFKTALVLRLYQIKEIFMVTSRTVTNSNCSYSKEKTMRSVIKTTLVIILLTISSIIINAQQITNIYYSVDIGSDLEFSDPFQDGDEVLDPGDIYGVQLGSGTSRQLEKDDSQIFLTDPPPSSTADKVPVGYYPEFDITWTESYFDMDGEDQISRNFINFDPPLGNVSPGGGLMLNPDILLFSYEDDTELGWWKNDVPVTVLPDHGLLTDEILHSIGWYSWGTDMPYSDETQIGLAQNPSTTPLDDDVDALDTQTNRYWYWTSDHEAHLGTDPGDIYVTDRNASGYALAFDNLYIGVPNGTDIDAFELCVTDDSTILTHFGLNVANAPYLAIIFSVDQDDPDTIANESGGLDPKTIYISLFTGLAPGPMPLCEKSEDVDAIALEEPPRDWGDAPAIYPTLLVNNGARHNIVYGYNLGTLIDAEDDGQPTPNALGDDLTNLPDEDGVTFTTTLYAGQLVNIVVTATGNGFLSGWFDYNNNGSWGDAGDAVFTDLTIGSGVNNIVITLGDTFSPTAYTTYARFRFSSQSVANDYGLAVDGEVEDYQIIIEPNPDESGQVELDYGDAPPMYPVQQAQNGARHAANMPTVFIGIPPDTEPDGQPTPDSLGDNITNVNDEDGIVPQANFIKGSNTTINVTASANGFLTGWIDFNQDNDWAGEQIVNQALVPGPNSISVAVPSSTEVGDTSARFRYSTISGLSYTGFAADGEVEDYMFTIMQVASTNLVVTNMVVMTNSNVEVKWNNEPNILYQLQSTTNLTTNTTWTTLKTVIGGISIDSNATEQLKYYRIVAPFTP